MRFLKEEEGQGLIEYALVLVLVAVVVIAVFALLGPYINDWLASFSQWFRQAIGAG
jgi:pilus assembly protein Flp/PilA